MEKVDINVCVRPYVHDVVDTITRKPVYRKSVDKHYITYKKQSHPLVKTSGGFVIWIDEE